MHAPLVHSDGVRTFAELAATLRPQHRDDASLAAEIAALWSARALTLRPSRDGR